jgi:preprotein translocase subunit SecD
MRARSFRLSILILFILGLSLAALGFRDIKIDVPGFPELQRGGTGPLGLKLGLDLRGGGHLVYQADTGSRFLVTFNKPADLGAVTGVLTDLGFQGFEVEPRGLNVVQIRTPLLGEADTRRQELRSALESKVGTIDSFEFTEIRNPTPQQMEGVLDIINRRVNLFGTEEPIIQRFGDDRIIVQLPGATGSVTELQFVEGVPDSGGTETVRSLLAGAGYDGLQVERRDERSFRIKSATVSSAKGRQAQAAVAEKLGAIAQFQVTSGIDEAKALIGQTARLEFKDRTCADPACFQFTDSNIGLTGDDLSRAFSRADPVGAGWDVVINFNGRGSGIFSDLTQRISPPEVRNTRRIAIFLDDQEILAPVALAWIRDGITRITGDFTRQEARTLAIQLESGRLPVPLKLVQETDVDALLGAESLRNSLIAGVVGLGLVMLFMVAYYRMAGVVASVALVFYALLLLAVFKLVPITSTLSHIGGFILSIGMAVDANVLIFERMKEEMRIGRTLASSMEVGFSRAWPAIRDSNVSTIITCLVLLWFGDRLGGALVTGFALSLLIGVMASMFTAIIVSRNLLQLLAWIGLGHRIGLFTPEGAPGRTQTVGGRR